jgi:hypothetical protein
MDRRAVRVGLTVLHRHRVGAAVPEDRTSELAYLRGGPKAILDWIDVGGMRTPICVDLDPAKLVSTGESRRFAYTETTTDPREDRRHVSKTR